MHGHGRGTGAGDVRYHAVRQKTGFLAVRGVGGPSVQEESGGLPGRGGTERRPHRAWQRRQPSQVGGGAWEGLGATGPALPGLRWWDP